MTTEAKRQITLPIKGMTCASCVSHVAHALEEAPGVEEATVNLATEKATVKQGLEAAMLGDLVRAVEDAGYGVGTDKITLGIGGMTCASCVGHVEHALRGVEGVLSSGVNLATERATVEYVPGVAGISEMRHAVEDAGYSVVAVVGDEHDDAATPKDVSVLQRKFIFSLVVAGGGFSRGNIYGASDSTSSDVEKNPVMVPDVLTTVYKQLGIVADKELMAPGARPIEIVKGGKVIKDLLT